MALVDVYEVRVGGTVLGEQWNLVYHLLRSGGSYDASDMVGALYDSTHPELRACMTDDTIITGYTAKSLGDPLDFYEVAVSSGGNIGSSDTISAFVAATIRFTRKRTDMHHGYKRIPGVSESYVSDGVISGTLLTNLNALGTALITQLEVATNPGVKVAEYVIVKRVLDGGVYRLPEIDAELVHYTPSSFTVNTHMMSQNSRKP